MPMLSYVHQLFNADQCQAYIHTLRWKDRPLQCPRCQSHNVGPWGAYHYQPGLKRYRCKEKECKRTFNDLTGTLLDGSKRSVMYWILATFLLCLSCSSRRIARELGVHGRTSYRWSWWLRNTALSYETDRQLAGTVEADDLYHTAGHKGQAQGGGKKALGRRARGRRKKREPGRGHYDKDRPAMIAWVSRQGAVVIQATRDFTVQTVQKAADLAMQAGSRLYTDSASSYRALKGYVHDSVGGVSNVDINGNNTLQIKAIGVVISTFETLPEIDHIDGDRRNARVTNLQALHGHCHDAKTREHGDYLPHGMRDQHQDTEERSARKRARSVLEQREVERSASRL